jgi:hypothetical protein
MALYAHEAYKKLHDMRERSAQVSPPTAERSLYFVGSSLTHLRAQTKRKTGVLPRVTSVVSTSHVKIAALPVIPIHNM